MVWRSRGEEREEGRLGGRAVVEVVVVEVGGL